MTHPSPSQSTNFNSEAGNQVYGSGVTRIFPGASLAEKLKFESWGNCCFFVNVVFEILRAFGKGRGCGMSRGFNASRGKYGDLRVKEYVI